MTMRKPFATAVLFASFIACAHAGARDELNAFANGLKGLDGQFQQQVFDGGGKPKESSSGEVSLSRPNLFRWEYRKPYAQLIVADGHKIWNYEPDLQQVSVRSQSGEEAHSPLTVLTDLSQLDSQFTASESGERDGFTWLKLTSKAKEPEFEYAELGFSGTSLERMLFKDQLGNTTEIDFSNWRRNPKIDASEFTFTPPKGVDVIGNMDPGAEIHPIRD